MEPTDAPRRATRALIALALLGALPALATSPVRKRDQMAEAIARGDLAGLSGLLEAKHSPDALTFIADGSPLALAIERKQLESMALLLRHKADVGLMPPSLPPGWTLRCAARLAGAKFEAGVADAGGKTNPTCEAEVAYVLAVRAGDVSQARRGPGPMGTSLGLAALALSSAIATGKAPLIDAVIAASGNPQLPLAAGVSTFGLTDLDADVEASLIGAGATGRDLQMALEEGKEALAVKLVAALKDVNAPLSEGAPRSLLQIAVHSESLPTVVALVKRGANVNALVVDQPLFLWAFGFHEKPALVKALLKGKPDFSLRTRDGRSGLELAAQRCDDGSMLDAFFRAGARLPPDQHWPLLKVVVGCAAPAKQLAVLGRNGLPIAAALKANKKEIWAIANWASPQRKALYQLGLPVQPR